MDIKSINPTIRRTFRLVRTSGGEEDVTIEIGPVSIGDVPDYLPKVKGAPVPRTGRIVQQALIDAVVGWDLTRDGQPIPCTPEEKAVIMPALLGMKVKPDEGEDANDPYGTLGWKLYILAQDDGNFLGG